MYKVHPPEMTDRSEQINFFYLVCRYFSLETNLSLEKHFPIKIEPYDFTETDRTARYTPLYYEHMIKFYGRMFGTCVKIKTGYK